MDFKDFCKTWRPFDEYRVHISIGMISGGIPKHPDLIAGWINATNEKKSDEERAKLVEATIEELPTLAEEKAARSWVGFKSDDQGIYIEGRQLKSMLKESANIIKAVAPTRKSKKSPKGIGITAFKNKTADHVFVVEEKVHLKYAGEFVHYNKEGKLEKPHSSDERPIHVMTPRGERTSLKKTDVLREVELVFTIRRLNDSAVTEKALYALILYSSQVGIGADRSQGSGVFEVISVEKSVESCLPEGDSE